MGDGMLCFEPQNYLACHRDDGNRDFGFGPQEYGFNQITCREACHEYPYFALQNGGWCSCDFSFGNPEDAYPVIDDEECGQADLDGNRMGGGWANAVYVNNMYEPESDFEYVGCYNDDGNRDFDFGPREYGFDQESCRAACEDYPFFALQNDGWCSCDFSYGSPSETYHVRDDNDCRNGAGEALGGGWANAVYSNNKYIERDLKTPDDEQYYTLGDESCQ
jgi:hypothetical protein